MFLNKIVVTDTVEPHKMFGRPKFFQFCGFLNYFASSLVHKTYLCTAAWSFGKCPLLVENRSHFGVYMTPKS